MEFEQFFFFPFAHSFHVASVYLEMRSFYESKIGFVAEIWWGGAFSRDNEAQVSQ